MPALLDVHNVAMPGCDCPPDYDAIFSEREARRELRAYRRRGAASGATADLIRALSREGVSGVTVLDIGAGIGAVHLELLDRGAATATDVDHSRAYLAAAHEEAQRRGVGERVSHRYGDLVELAEALQPADVVTLDRVICCYPDMQALVGRSVGLARRLYGLVYPVDRWWVRVPVRIGNVLVRLFRVRFEFFVHRERAVDALVRSAGFELRHARRGLLWQTVVYRRVV